MISDIKSLLDHLNEESGLASKFKKDPKTKQQGDDIDSTVRAAREIIKNMLALDSSSEDFRILNEFFTNANLNNKNPKSIAAILGFARLAKAANFVTNHAFGLERPNPTDAVAYNKWLTKIGEKLGIPKTGDLETWKIAVETAFRRWVSDRVMDYASSETLRKSVDKMMADTAAKKTLTGDELAKEWLKDTSKSVADLKGGSKLHEALTKLTDREKLIMGAICNGKSPCTHWKDGCERYRKAGRRST